MKKSIFTIILLAIMLTALVSCRTQQNASDEAEAESTENAENAETQQSVSFASDEELAEKFMEVCEQGDVEKMYALYYNDMLGATYERIKENDSKEDFDATLKEEMRTISRYELYKYGGEELTASVSPLYYVDYMHYSSSGEDTGLTDEQVTDCSVLRVYKDNSAYSDHMLAKIDGEWYVTI